MQDWELLMQNTKMKLARYAASFGERMPASWKKERMARRLAELIAANPEQTLMLLSAKTVQYMREALRVHPDGILPYPADNVGPTESSEPALEWIPQRGHVFACEEIGLMGMEERDGQRVVVMTEAGRNTFRPGVGPDSGKLRFLDSVYLCAAGIVYTYGAIETGDMNALLSRCFPGEDVELLEWIVDFRVVMHEPGISVVTNQTKDRLWYTVVDDLDEFGQLMRELAQRQNISRRLFTRKQYEFAAKTGWPFYPDNYDSLLKLLTEQGMDQEDAEECLDEVISLHQTGMDDVNDAFEMILDECEDLDKRQLDTALEQIMGLLNSVPMWTLWGNSPNDLAQKPQGRVLPFPKRGGRNP